MKQTNELSTVKISFDENRLCFIHGIIVGLILSEQSEADENFLHAMQNNLLELENVLMGYMPKSEIREMRRNTINFVTSNKGKLTKFAQKFFDELF